MRQGSLGAVVSRDASQVAVGGHHDLQTTGGNLCVIAIGHIFNARIIAIPFYIRFCRSQARARYILVDLLQGLCILLFIRSSQHLIGLVASGAADAALIKARDAAQHTVGCRQGALFIVRQHALLDAAARLVLSCDAAGMGRQGLFFLRRAGAGGGIDSLNRHLNLFYFICFQRSVVDACDAAVAVACCTLLFCDGAGEGALCNCS